MFSLGSIMSDLSKERPIFHSEADFQHALAWKIAKSNPDLSIRLEYNPWEDIDNKHVDLWILDTKREIALELKYRTRKIKYIQNREKFFLKNQSACDQGRYDFCKDIKKLESIKRENSNFTKYAIFLTNDPEYWESKSERETFDYDFKIHHGKDLSGNLKWHFNASKGTTKNREKEITLKGKYKLQWKDYSNIPNEKNGQFRYVIIKIE
jgi:hypothetical protein